jgi:hypothetical protein
VITILSSSSWGCRDEADTIELSIQGHGFEVEVARTAEERQRGLMDRSAIPERGGMLFVFPESDYRAFWMKDTSLPLSLAFISSTGMILEIHRMEPFSLERVESRSPAKYALEVRRGVFEELGITAGDRVLLPEDL